MSHRHRQIRRNESVRVAVKSRHANFAVGEGLSLPPFLRYGLFYLMTPFSIFTSEEIPCNYHDCCVSISSFKYFLVGSVLTLAK